MSAKALKIALAVSVALNLFAVTAGATLAISRERIQDRVEAEKGPGRTRSPMGLVSRLSPEVQEPVRETLRAAALSAKPDFREAREKRRQAIELARQPAFDPAQVTLLLDQSRAAELRGRQRLEVEAVSLLGELTPADRAILAEILARKRGHDRDRDRRSEAKAVTPAPAAG